MDRSDSAYLTGALVFYAAAFVGYLGAPFSESVNLEALPAWIARLGWVFHTGALLARWRAEGLGHPPWTTLYESLAFFSWGAVAALVFAELRYKVRHAGAFAMAIAACALLTAQLLSAKAPEPLTPELQSYWLIFHASMGCLAYAFFMLAAFLSMFFLLKDRVRLETIAAYLSGLVAVGLPLAAGWKKLEWAQPLAFDQVLRDYDGNFVIMSSTSSFVAIPWGGTLLSCVCALFALHFVLGAAASMRPQIAREDGIPARFLGYPGEVTDWQGMALRALFLTATLGLFLIVFLLVWDNIKVPGYKIFSNPMRIGGFFFALSLVSAVAVFTWARKNLEAKLPTADRLDRLSYQAIVVAFPFMTLNLLSGSVWAHYAWGRYWGWDPKEVWGLLTWLTYAMALHLRLMPGVSSRKVALYSIFGFFVVMFGFLGVNLLMPGLHAFAR